MEKYKIETERADLFDVNMMIAISVTLRGTASHEKIEKAFHTAVSANKILNTKVVIEEDGSAYYVACEGARNNIYFSTLNITDLINEQEKVRFRIEDGEYLRLFVDDSADVMKLHFLMHHLGGDGKSLCYYVEDFLLSLNDEPIQNKTLVNLTTDNIPNNCGLPFGMKWYVQRYNRSWEKEKQIFGFDDLRKSFERFWQNNQTKVELSEINENELLHLLEKCHCKAIGFTAYFIAALLKDTKKKQDVGIAVDGRLDGNKCMGNQATGVSIDYKYHNNKSVMDNAIKINRAMHHRLDNQRFKYFILQFMASISPTLVDAVNLQHVNYFSSKTSQKLAYILGYGEKTKDWSITNLTVLDIPVDYGQYHIEKVYFIPPVISYGKNVIGLVTVNNQLYISKHYYQ